MGNISDDVLLVVSFSDNPQLPPIHHWDNINDKCPYLSRNDLHVHGSSEATPTCKGTNICSIWLVGYNNYYSRDTVPKVQGVLVGKSFQNSVHMTDD